MFGILDFDARVLNNFRLDINLLEVCCYEIKRLNWNAFRWHALTENQYKFNAEAWDREITQLLTENITVNVEIAS